MRPVQYATEIDYDRCPYPLIGLVKYEGVFGTVWNGALYTREGNRVSNIYIQRQFADFVAYCDEHGHEPEFEITIEGNDFNFTSGVVRSKDVETVGCQLRIFDMHIKQMYFKFRLVRASKLVAALDRRDIKLAEWKPVANKAEAVAFHAANYAKRAGTDGSIFRAPFSYYKAGGRPSNAEANLLRDKFVKEMGGVITAVHESIDKHGVPKGMAHSVTLEVMVDGKPVLTDITMTKGLTNADRVSLWLERADRIGKHMDFLSNGFDGMEFRHTRFLKWREDKDAHNTN